MTSQGFMFFLTLIVKARGEAYLQVQLIHKCLWYKGCFSLIQIEIGDANEAI